MKIFLFEIIILMFSSICGLIQRVNMRRAIKNSGGSCEYIQGVGEICSVPVTQ